jgi:hypothetical protein
MANVDDPHIEELIAAITVISARLASRMAELAVAQETAVRIAMRDEIQLILQELRQEVQNWLTNVFGDFIQQMDEDLMAEVPEDVLEVQDIDLSMVELSDFIQQFQRDIDTAVQSIEAMVSRLARGDASQVIGEDQGHLLAALAAGAAGAAAIASIRARAQERLRESLLHLLGANGRFYRYDLGYYIALSAHVLKGRLQKGITLIRGKMFKIDLVQVSKNPSTIGDYCDLYRGKVFSISGAHPIFHPLALAPAKGTPFHPWCHHKLRLFDESGLTDKEKMKLAFIPKEFLELGKIGAGPNEFQRLWQKQKKKLRGAVL